MKFSETEAGKMLIDLMPYSDEWTGIIDEAYELGRSSVAKRVLNVTWDTNDPEPERIQALNKIINNIRLEERARIKAFLSGSQRPSKCECYGICWHIDSEELAEVFK